MTINTAEFAIRYKTKQAGVLGLFAAALFLSNALIFWLVPLSIKTILKNANNIPWVWNVSLLFFVSVIIIGFWYTHISTKKFNINKQITIQIVLLITAIVLFPTGIGQLRLPNDIGVTPELLLLLTTTIGLPLFAIATTLPMIQHWYSYSLHPQAQDPYFLFVPGSVGGLAIVICYPYFFSTHFNVIEQANLWLLFFIVFFILFSLCAITIKNTQITKSQRQKYFARTNLQKNTEQITNSISFQQGFYWALLIFVPTSLLISLVTYITFNIGNVPYFELSAIGLFLLAFSIGFSRRTAFEYRYSIIIQYGLLFFSVLSYAFYYLFNYPLIIVIHSATFFFSVFICISEINKRRPLANYLIDFYLWLSLGVISAFAFNKLLAPQLFTNVVEYPISLALACLVRPPIRKVNKKTFMAGDVLIPLTILYLFYLLSLSGAIKANTATPSMIVLIYFLLTTIVFAYPERPLCLCLGVGSLLISAMLFLNPDQNDILFIERNLNGIIKITSNQDNHMHSLMSNNVLLGAQYFDYKNGEMAPYIKKSQVALCTNDSEQEKLSMIAINHLHDQGSLTYYAPLREILTTLRTKSNNLHVAFAGIGSGTAACFAHPTDEFIFYENNLTLINIAYDRRYFTYFTDCTPKALVVNSLQNGLQNVPDNYYDLIVFDNLSSALSPKHFITNKIIKLNLEKLSENGILAFNITNQFIDLREPLSRIADSFRLVTRIRIDSQSDWQNYKLPSVWIVMARKNSDLGEIDNNPAWQPLPPSDFQNIWQNSYFDLW